MSDPDYVIFAIELQLSTIFFRLFDTKLLFSADFHNFQLNFSLRPGSYYLRLYLESFMLKDINASELIPYTIDSGSIELILDKKKLKMITEKMDVMVNILPLMSLVKSIIFQLSQQIDLNKLVSAASERTYKFIKDGQDYVKNIIQHGTVSSFAIDINVKAPTIFVPNKENSQFLVIDLGRLTLITSFYKGKNDYYDNFLFSLTDTKIVTV